MSEEEEKENDYPSRGDLMMEKLEEKARKDAETVDMTIYDVPVELKNKIISMAKLHYDNHAWLVLADAMDALLEERTSRVEALEDKVSELEAEIDIVKGMQKYSDDQRNSVTKGEPTFGEMRSVDTSDDLEKLKELSQRGDTQNE